MGQNDENIHFCEIEHLFNSVEMDILALLQGHFWDITRKIISF